MLEALDYGGEVVPYMRSKRWIDGSVSNDLPMLRLARLHNINHYIVSQTNPHIVPFMREPNRRKRSLATYARDMATVAGRDLIKVTRDHLGGLGAMRIVDTLNEVMQQRYSGDINIVPKHTAQQLMRMFANPTVTDIRRFIQEGERGTWPRLERVFVQTRISRALDDCLEWLKDRSGLRDGIAPPPPERRD
jgi:predicted acylesterase/phospholipase RssA